MFARYISIERTHLPYSYSRAKYWCVLHITRPCIGRCIVWFQASLSVARYKAGARITNILFLLNAAAAALGCVAALKVLVFLLALEEFLVQASKVGFTES